MSYEPYAYERSILLCFFLSFSFFFGQQQAVFILVSRCVALVIKPIHHHHYYTANTVGRLEHYARVAHTLSSSCSRLSSTASAKENLFLFSFPIPTSGTAMHLIRALFAAKTPFNESSTATHLVGSTPSLAAAAVQCSDDVMTRM